jgi:hypothetical protein
MGFSCSPSFTKTTDVSPLREVRRTYQGQYMQNSATIISTTVQPTVCPLHYPTLCLITGLPLEHLRILTPRLDVFGKLSVLFLLLPRDDVFHFTHQIFRRHY